MKYGFRFLLPLAMLCLFSACTKTQTKKASLTIKLPSSYKKQGLHTQAMELHYFAVNIHIPGEDSPRVEGIDVHNDNGTAGSVDTLTITDLPIGDGVITQILGVFADSNEGTENFAYGDLTHSLVPGENSLVIEAEFIGSATKRGSVGGRYLTGSNIGPTGTMIGSIQPPGDKPAMDVIKQDIFNGWFEIMVFDSSSASFTYRLEDSDEVIFDSVNIATFDALGTSSHFIKVVAPKSYDLESTTPTPATDYYFGFLGAPGVTISGKNVCYQSTPEGIKNVFENNTKSSPLIFNGASPDPNRAHVVSGGVAKAMDEFYNASATPANNCEITNNQLIFYHQRLSEGEEAAFGFSGPYQLLNPFADHEGYTHSSFDGANTITLNWKYLPDIDSTVLDGTTVYAKLHTSGNDDNGGGGDDLPCDQVAAEEGYQSIGDLLISDSPNDSLNFTGLGGSLVNNSNSYDWRFLICPFKEKTEGRHYFITEEADHCRGGCQSIEHFGHGIRDATLTTPSFSSAATELGGVTGRIGGISVGSDYTTVVLLGETANGDFRLGEEILFHVSGHQGAGCGASVGGNQFAFTKIIFTDGTDSTPTLKIPKGTFLDSVSTTFLSNPQSNTNFCYIQAIQVPNIRNLDLNGQDVIPSQFFYNNFGGGAIAFRVNGTLTLNGDITAAINAGYQGGNGTDNEGSGIGGASGSNVNGGAGGSPQAGGGGSEGIGATGSSDGTSTDGGSGGSGSSGGDNHGFKFFMGGGGGYDGGSNGGRGGAMMFIAANQIQVTGTNDIIAYGQTSGTTNAGGGGGGSINLIAQDIADGGAGSLSLQAQGGSNMTAAAIGGGGGGGGWIRAGACTDTSEVLFADSDSDSYIDNLYNSAGAGGVVSGGSSADGNYTESFDDGDTDNDDRSYRPHFCN